MVRRWTHADAAGGHGADAAGRAVSSWDRGPGEGGRGGRVRRQRACDAAGEEGHDALELREELGLARAEPLLEAAGHHELEGVGLPAQHLGWSVRWAVASRWRHGSWETWLRDICRSVRVPGPEERRNEGSRDAGARQEDAVQDRKRGEAVARLENHSESLPEEHRPVHAEGVDCRGNERHLHEGAGGCRGCRCARPGERG